MILSVFILRFIVEPRGVKSNYFVEDLVVFTKNYSQEQIIILGNKKWSQEE